jgi:mannan endo-1,4-beta-mannosidase
VAPAAPYFGTETGRAWTPIGQNDAVTWPELAGLFRARDLPAVETHLRRLVEQGVTTLRLMLEYCHGEHRYLERPTGHFQPNMVRLWDDLFALCERVGMRVLLTPYDTFFTWIRWAKHPLNQANGGPCAARSRLLLCRNTREAIKRRLAFATERWGGSGALWAWDLWNEIHPAHAGGSSEGLGDFIQDVGEHLRALELRLHGRAHPQTVSVFGPALARDAALRETVFRHPALDFASSHFYEAGSIDNPRNTVDAAVATGRLTREALAEIKDLRPFLDSEHGPIHAFKDRHRTLPGAFDDEYFRHMQWAHFASGGAGGGMRWPNRRPHTLTPGMRSAQGALAAFLPLVDWSRFQRKNLNAELRISAAGIAGFACSDDTQAVAWLLRTDSVGRDGTLRREVAPLRAQLRLPGLGSGRYRATAWDTLRGIPTEVCEFSTRDGECDLTLPPIRTDLAVAVRRAGG